LIDICLRSIVKGRLDRFRGLCRGRQNLSYGNNYSTETTSKQPIFSFSQISFSFHEHVAEVDQSLFQI